MKLLKCISPFEKAWERTASTLFKPFIFIIFFKIAFIAWLANLGGPYGCQSSGNFNGGDISNIMKEFKKSEQKQSYDCKVTEEAKTGIFHISSLSKISKDIITSGNCPRTKIANAFEQMKKDMGVAFIVIMVFITVLIPLIIILSLLIAWVKCRGKFMFIDTLVKNEGNKISIAEKWKTAKKCGNSYFGFIVLLMFIELFIIFIFLGVYALILYPWIAEMIRLGELQWPTALITTLTAVWTLIFVTFSIAVSVVLIAFDDIGTLMMYRRDIPAWTAFKRTVRGIIENPVGIIQYLIIIIFYSIAATTLVATLQILTCCLCCIGFIMVMLPFVWMLAELPIFVLRQFFMIEFSKQFGDDFDADGKQTEKTEEAVQEALAGEACDCV